MIGQANEHWTDDKLDRFGSISKQSSFNAKAETSSIQIKMGDMDEILDKFERELKLDLDASQYQQNISVPVSSPVADHQQAASVYSHVMWPTPIEPWDSPAPKFICYGSTYLCESRNYQNQQIGQAPIDSAWSNDVPILSRFEEQISIELFENWLVPFRRALRCFGQHGSELEKLAFLAFMLDGEMRRMFDRFSLVERRTVEQAITGLREKFIQPEQQIRFYRLLDCEQSVGESVRDFATRLRYFFDAVSEFIPVKIKYSVLCSTFCENVQREVRAKLEGNSTELNEFSTLVNVAEVIESDLHQSAIVRPNTPHGSRNVGVQTSRYSCNPTYCYYYGAAGHKKIECRIRRNASVPKSIAVRDSE